MKAWHFTSENMTLRNGDGRKIVVGETLSCDGDIAPCENGMHGSKRIIDALQYAPGPILTRVEITGDVIEGHDKIAGRHRKVLWSLDATEILHRFAVQVALDACQKAGITDSSVLAAPQAKLDWLDGKISDKELAAVRSAALSAAKSAWSATRSARLAARSAASATSSPAAWSAKWAVTWSTESAKSAAWLTMREAARTAQEELLKKMVSETEWV